VVSFQHNQTRAFNDHLFYLDFIHALRRLAVQQPFLGEHQRWRLALAEADEEDVARRVAGENARGDADYYRQQHAQYCARIDGPSTRELVRTNGRVGTLEGTAANRLDAKGKERVTHTTKWESVPARDYSREAYAARVRRR
jgi:hypothetical protein